MIRVGFTGTQEGTTAPQRRSLRGVLLAAFRTREPGVQHRGKRFFHHGICVGSDAEAHHCVRLLPHLVRVVGHPPVDRSRVDARSYRDCDELRPPRPYIARNHDVVDATDHLVATPSGPERTRSGTWATIRYARRLGRRITIVWPDGTVELENVEEITL